MVEKLKESKNFTFEFDSEYGNYTGDDSVDVIAPDLNTAVKTIYGRYGDVQFYEIYDEDGEEYDVKEFNDDENLEESTSRSSQGRQVWSIVMDVMIPADKKASTVCNGDGELYKIVTDAIEKAGYVMAGDYLGLEADITDVYEQNDFFDYVDEV